MFLIYLKCDMCKKKVPSPDYECPNGWFSVKEMGRKDSKIAVPFWEPSRERKHYCSRECLQKSTIYIPLHDDEDAQYLACVDENAVEIDED